MVEMIETTETIEMTGAIQMTEMVDMTDTKNTTQTIETIDTKETTEMTAHSPPPLTLKGETITIKQQTKLLGIVFDTKPYWNDHIEYLITRCKKCINLIRSLSGTR
nr:unnamed protein product [Callosobruchus chinensis]